MIPDFYPELKEYQHILFNSSLGKMGRKYLQQRNITVNTAKYWQLGFSPVDYDPICYKFLLKENITYFWRKLNNRIIIPIFDSNNKLISLSGRSINNQFPKYIHYPFPARRILFGLNNNKDNIRDKDFSIITEGQLDVISAWQNDIKEITCSFGAHVSQEHFALLGRYTNNIYIIYDNDAAGIKGMQIAQHIHCADLFIKSLFNLFPAGQDLDNWIQNHSNTEFYNLLHNYDINQLKTKINKIQLQI